MRGIAIGIGLSSGLSRSAGGVLPPGLPRYIVEWLLRGVWDDLVPTSDAWSRFSGWLIGTWADGAPTTAGSWASPTGENAVWTIWDDAEVTE